MIPSEALDVTQIQITEAETLVAMVVAQSDQPVGYFIVSCIELALVAIAGLVDAKCHQETLIQIPRSVTDFLAITLLRDSLTNFFLASTTRSRL